MVRYSNTDLNYSVHMEIRINLNLMYVTNAYKIACCSSATPEEGKSKSFGRKAVSFVLITVTGGVALSALDDLAIYHGCSRYVCKIHRSFLMP